MLKLVFLALSLAVAANAAGLGSWQDATVGEVQELALWSTQQMTTMSGLEGDYTIQTPRNVRKQVVNGINYKFTLDVVVRDSYNKYTVSSFFGKFIIQILIIELISFLCLKFKSCEIFINDQPWAQTRTFVDAPVCKNTVKRDLQPEEWTAQTAITDVVMNLARWSAAQLSAYTGIKGEHTVMTVKNVQTQFWAGINYKFTLDVLINNSKTGKYTVSFFLFNF
jgi:hypothetical protein